MNKTLIAEAHKKHFKKLVYYCQRFVSKDEAEESVQEAFSALLLHREMTFEHMVRWLYKVSWIKALGKRKQTAKQNEVCIDLVFDTFFAPNYIEPEDDGPENPMLAVLRHCMQGISPTSKLIFYMRVNEGLKFCRIAARLNISTANAIATFHNEKNKILRRAAKLLSETPQ
jgi:DNA-directed RNA polymerase specialized sigma24 family protein